MFWGKKGGGVVLEDDQPPFVKSLDLLKVNAFKKEISHLSVASWWGTIGFIKVWSIPALHVKCPKIK